MALEHANLASRAVGAGAWTVGTRFAAKLIDLALMVCLARFLGPAEFGLVAMAMAVVVVVETLFELPMVAALIRVPTLTADMLHTAFTLSLLRGLVIALVLFALSWPLASFNGEPRLTALLAVLTLAPAMRGLINPRMVEYARALNFRPDAIMELTGKVVAFVIAVAIAVSTHSYWAIAVATICGPMVATLLSYCIAPLRPRLTFTEWKRFSNLVGWNFVSQLCSAFNWQIDRLLLPRLTITSAFGQYAMGRQIAEIPLQALMQPLIRPAMSTLADSGSARASRYVQLQHAIALILAPTLGFLFVWSEVLIRLALGPVWLPAAEWLRWISAITFLGLPAILLGPLVMTLDRTRWLAIRSALELLIRLPLVWLLALKFGIPGAVVGGAIASASGTVSAMLIVRRLAGISLLTQLSSLWIPFAALIPAGTVLYLGKSIVMENASFGGFVGLAFCFGIMYWLVYGVSTLLVWWAIGQPAGIEQHFYKAVRSRLTGINSRRFKPDTQESAQVSGRLDISAKHPE